MHKMHVHKLAWDNVQAQAASKTGETRIELLESARDVSTHINVQIQTDQHT